MKFPASITFPVFISELSLSIIIVAVTMIVIAIVVRIAITIHIRKVREKKRKALKAELDRKQAQLDEEYLQKKAKLLEERAKIKKEAAQKEAGRLARLEERRQLFCKSSEYKFIQQFAGKYENSGNESEFAKLQLLLKNRQWDFSLEELKEFIQDEYWQKLDDFLNEKVFANTPSTLEEAIRIFLEQYNSDDLNMDTSIAYLLKKDGFHDIDAVGGEKILFNFLKAKIKKIEREIELECFKKRLGEDNEQIWVEYIG